MKSIQNLFLPLRTLKGVGDTLEQKFQRLNCYKVIDLLLTLPQKIEEIKLTPSLMPALINTKILICVEILAHKPPFRKSGQYSVSTIDSTGNTLQIIFFHTYKDFIIKQMPVGQKRLIVGILETFRGGYQIVHPESIGPYTQKNLENWQGIQPIYALTQGVTQRVYRTLMNQSLSILPDLPEWLPEDLVRTSQWPSFKKALFILHGKIEVSSKVYTQAYARIAFDEIFAQQLTFALVRRFHKKTKGPIAKIQSSFYQTYVETLPFSLTEGQQRVLRDIQQDLYSGEHMKRLLLGDVGSGKTILAFLSAIQMCVAGYQVAFLVPTEVLALQHFETFSKLFHTPPMRHTVLLGRHTLKQKQDIYTQIRTHQVDFVIGTHALLEEGVSFLCLGLVIIDEQHRFGVNQRLALFEKGESPHILSMSATPIPRSYLMTFYGDLEVSMLRDKPKGRLPIQTRVIPLERIQKVIEALQRLVCEGKKVYWICPLIEESENLEVSHVMERYSYLQEKIPYPIGILHGQMSGVEKDTEIKRFQRGETVILVATTVVEVGVDVPEAMTIVIENAERFGLAQLHQLRGRVGRGAIQSYCILLYKSPLSSTGQQRLEMLRTNEDGFTIAEFDFQLRGGGEIFGTRQSGQYPFKVANIFEHHCFLEKAKQLGQTIIKKDKVFYEKEKESLQILLKIFQYDTGITYLDS